LDEKLKEVKTGGKYYKKLKKLFTNTE